VLFLADCLVMWGSRAQSTPARSAFEAEFTAVAACGASVRYIQNVMRDFLPVNAGCVPAMCTVYSDNDIALKELRGDLKATQRTKHIDRDFWTSHFEYQAGLYSGSVNPADLLTKSLDSAKHKRFTSMLLSDASDA